MAYSVDTNVMWRRFIPGDPRHSIAVAAIDTLMRRGETLVISAQNLIEFRSLATRPPDVNGLGMTTAQAIKIAREIQAFFTLLPDTADIYPHWQTLVDTYDVKGRQVHDARLAAVMLTHGITHLLTFNPADFRRFSEITVVEPQNVLEAATI